MMPEAHPLPPPPPLSSAACQLVLIWATVFAHAAHGSRIVNGCKSAEQSPRLTNPADKSFSGNGSPECRQSDSFHDQKSKPCRFLRGYSLTSLDSWLNCFASQTTRSRRRPHCDLLHLNRSLRKPIRAVLTCQRNEGALQSLGFKPAQQ